MTDEQKGMEDTATKRNNEAVICDMCDMCDMHDICDEFVICDMYDISDICDMNNMSDMCHIYDMRIILYTHFCLSKLVL